MNKSNSFPDWFKNILIGIGGYSLLYVVSKYFASHIPIIALSYPIALYFVMLFESNPAENWNEHRAKHFTNISLSIIGCLTLIQIFKYDYFIGHAGKLIIGANEIFFTENYYVKITIYILTLLFFIIVGVYLTFKIARRIESLDGIGAFQVGKKIWSDVVLPVPQSQKLGFLVSPEYIEKQKKEALKFFDKAIEKGYHTAEVFSLRGRCLNYFGFYFDAIEDFNKAIELNPKQGIASNYHMRSIIKEAVFDFEGSLTDIEEAIRLSKLDNDDNEYWNEYSKTTGFNTATQFYEWQREMIKLRLDLDKGRMINRTIEMKSIKRR